MSNKIISVKKILAVAIAMAMVLAFVPAAFAATITITDCQVNDDSLLLTVNLGSVSGTEHFIAIVTTPTAEATYDNALAFQYVKVNSATREIEILMPDEVATGNYKVTVGMPSATPVSVNFTYMGKDDRTAIMDNVNSADADAATLVSAFDRNAFILNASGSNNAYFTALTNEAKLKVGQYIIDNREAGDEDGSGALSLTEIGALANEAMIVAYFDSTLSKDKAAYGYNTVIKDFADQGYSFGLDTSDARYKKITNAVEFFRIVRAQAEYAPSLEGIEASIDAALTLQRINEAGWLEVADVISDYVYEMYIPEELTDEIITEEKLDEITKNSTIEGYFGKAMKAADSAYSFEELGSIWTEAYEKAVDDYDKYLKNKEDSKGSSSGGSSGGSGGSSGGNNVTSVVTVNKDAVRPDPLGKKKLVSDYYDDMEGYDWAAIAVLSLTEKGIINGNGDKKFSPARTLKREEFMKMLVNTFNIVDMTATCSFSDCDKDAWYYIYVASAEKAGITNGRGDGTFGVGDYVTREEMATMIYRAARSRGIKLSSSGKTTLYTDMNALSAYAVEAVTALTENGVMDGVEGRFDPQIGATRAQAAVAIYNISNLYNE